MVMSNQLEKFWQVFFFSFFRQVKKTGYLMKVMYNLNVSA